MSQPLFKSVLLVDDNEDDNFIHERYLSRSNWFEVLHVCISGPEALDKLAQMDPKPDVVFIDVNMPVMNGFQLLDTLQDRGAIGSATRIVMLTSSLHPNDREEADNSPVISAYINKPLTSDLLAELRVTLGV